MGKFGFKKNDDDEDSGRLALFGSRSKSKSPAPPSSNPYAQPNIPPDAYTQAKMNAGIISPPNMQGPDSQGPPPRSGYGAMGHPPQRQPGPYGGDNRYGPPQGGPQGGYGGGSGGGYGDNKFGDQKGYGAAQNGGNPYSNMSQPGGMARPGGYGGLGRTQSDDTAADTNRDELFGGARDRVQQRQQNGPPGYEYNPEQPAEESRSYGAYGDRQLTAEEEEEEDIQATKQEIRFMKQQDVASTRNALRIAAQAEEMGRNTLARLGAQGERMHNTDRNLDIGNNHINVAQDKTKELKTLNRSMFAVHVSNPFTAKERQARKDDEILDRHQKEREQREATRDAAFQSTKRMNQNFKEIESAGRNGAPKTKTNLNERGKYQFEADSEDENMENEIDNNLDQLSGAASRLNLLAKATGHEISRQNELIDNIAQKSDRFDDRLHMETERLKRIR